MKPIRQRYQDRLHDFPQAGGGRHQALLAISNLGVMAGIPPEQIHADIAAAAGSPRLPDGEIRKAINQALSDHRENGAGYRIPPRPAPIVKDGAAARRRIIDQGVVSTEVDLWELSPFRLHHTIEEDAAVFLSTMFDPLDYIFIGGEYDAGKIGVSIRRAGEWIEFFRAGGKAGPFIIINPFTGKPAPKKDGTGDSCRCDGAIARFRHCLIEFDTITIEDQIRFWSAIKLPIRALIHSGGKSIHAWIDVKKLHDREVATKEDWDRLVKADLYEQVLVPLGVDPQCCNPSRLSRLPGCYRQEKGRYQRLLWLSPEGREVSR